jgi:DNA (cytosine-5)-methyltransferase 1
MPHITKYYGAKSEAESRGGVLGEPIATQTTENRFGLVTAFLAKHYGGNYTGAGTSVSDPLHTVTAVDHNALVTTNLIHLRNNCDARSVEQPLPTLTAGGGHVGEVRAFLIKYYGNEKEGVSLREPLHTVTAQDRFGLVTVRGKQYQIVDIGMRMLEPHELFAAQGFPRDYIIDRDAEGNPIPKYKQVARCGNSVCPALAEALVRANYSVGQARKAA